MRKLSLILAAAIMIGGAGWSRDLTLEETLRLAAEASHQIKQAAAQSAAARRDLGAARTRRMPTISADLSYRHNSETPELSIEIPPPVNYSLSRKIGDGNTYLSSFALSAPLYTGGRLAAGIASDRANLWFQESMEKADRRRILLAARQAYFALVRSEGLVAAAEASLERAGIILRDVESLHNAGMADSLDILETRLALTQAELGVDQARSARREAAIQVRNLLLLPDDEDIALAEVPQPNLNRGRLPHLTDRPELAAASARVEVGEAGVRAASAEFWPTVSAYGGYSYGKPNLDQFGDTWNDYFFVGVNANWSFNLGRAAGHSVAASRHRERSAVESQRQLRADLDRDYRQSVERLDLTAQQYRSAVESRGISADYYRLARQQHREGVLSSNRLLEVEARLTEAESALAAALAQYYLARSAYYFASGSERLEQGFTSEGF